MQLLPRGFLLIPNKDHIKKQRQNISSNATTIKLRPAAEQNTNSIHLKWVLSSVPLRHKFKLWLWVHPHTESHPGGTLCVSRWVWGPRSCSVYTITWKPAVCRAPPRRAVCRLAQLQVLQNVQCVHYLAGVVGVPTSCSLALVHLHIKQWGTLRIYLSRWLMNTGLFRPRFYSGASRKAQGKSPPTPSSLLFQVRALKSPCIPARNEPIQ